MSAANFVGVSAQRDPGDSIIATAHQAIQGYYRRTQLMPERIYVSLYTQDEDVQLLQETLGLPVEKNALIRLSQVVAGKHIEAEKAG